MSKQGGHILVIGAATIDVKGRASKGLQLGTSVPGTIKVSFGGVARNVADNLARLGQSVVLISAVGKDGLGKQILERTAAAGVDVSNVAIVGDHSAAYVAILDEGGSKTFAVDEINILEAVTPALIQSHAELFRGAAMLALDANLAPNVLAAAIRAARRNSVPVAIDPTSATLAPRLKKHLADLAMITPNETEAGLLLDRTVKGRSEATAAAQELVARGVGLAVITLGEQGLCYASSRGSGYIPAIRCEVVDYTGAGDALTAAVVYGMVNDLPLDESMRLGVSAATLTLRCPDTVCPDMSLEHLYDQLVI
ncbi:MAG: Pseudouridine kinase [Chloroflexi bacterium ADurb.Bin180]|nr:MAG: Pseudouridine kinase [Chloroflexi bacterium ADurb.Bin180]HNR96074.1 carbohydrate kinase family protein [Anaerolineae bacterium]HNT04827.1 carbohydrate kinase family protein [Anaerolineae bacterium]HOU22753.1 carbohydrate kinase family protein [Anaerolineae bacterium]HQJ52125.1 carbohydrate kinase family protein [Anaerolineae bacterium]